MRLSRFFIENYHFTLVFFLIMMVIGTYSFFTMPRMEDPVVYISGGSVIVIYPGASPLDMEQMVALPIEETVNEMDDIRRISTSLRDGVATVSVEFEHGTNPRDKYNEMVMKINEAEGRLPDNITSIETVQWTSTDVSVMQLAFVSETADYTEMERAAELLRKQIETVWGVRKVELHAIPETELRVSLDMEKMATHNISSEQVIKAIQSSNVNIPGGSINAGGLTFGLRTSGSYESPDQLRRTIVGSYMGRTVYLENIADVHFTTADNLYNARYNGKRAVFLSVQQQEKMNVFRITGEIKQKTEKFAESYGEDDIQIVSVFDQSVNVDRRINSFLKNLFQGILLVGIVILLTMGFRSSLIVILAIPLSVVTGLGVVDISGFALEQVSVAALVVALGLLVDNSIVLTDNVNRWIEKGKNAKEAAIEGVSEIGWPVISATFTTFLAFIPIILLQDKAGDYIRSLPVTIIATLGFSLIITLSLSPLLASYLFRKKSRGRGRFRLFNKLLNWIISKPYKSVLKFALTNRLFILFSALLLLAVSYIVFGFVGVSFFPKAETPQLMIRVEMPEGSSLDKTDNAARWVESVLDTIPLVSHYATNVGKGNPRIYYNIFTRPYSRNFAEIYTELKRYDVNEYEKFIEDLRRAFASYPGASLTVKEFEQGVPMEAPVEIFVTGQNVDVLRKISGDVELMLLAQEGAVNIENRLDKTQTDLHFVINRDKAGVLGVPLYEIDRTVRMAVSGLTVSHFRDSEGKEYGIVLRKPQGDSIRAEDLGSIIVTSLEGKHIYMDQLATLEFRTSPSLVSRYNMQRNAAVLADIRRGFTLDDVLGPVMEQLEKYPFPQGYGYHISGELESRRETFGGMKRAILITIISIFGVLVFQFRSFIQPLIIFSAFPLAAVGSVWMLFATGYTFSFTAFIGLISLAGIVINNSIILVDYTNRLIKQGMDKDEAIREAGATRFTPILLTSVTTIGGLLPLTLQGGTLWAPMGWTIIGGLITSTFLTLIVVPVLYKTYGGNNGSQTV